MPKLYISDSLVGKFPLKISGEMKGTYFHKTVNGPVILIKSDRTNVNENFHK